MSNLSADERDKLPKEDFGDPERRKFPIVDQDDVFSSAHLIGRVANKDEVKKNIIKIAKRKKFRLPDSWREDDERSNHSTGDNMDNFTVSFSVSDKPSAQTGQWVMRRAPLIFKAGAYPDKDFTMTPDELLAAAADFKTAPIKMGHHNTVLDGKLGHLIEFRAHPDGTSDGAVMIPRWFHDQFAGKEIPISVSIDRKTKKISHLALESNPRIDGAKLEAAFSKGEKEYQEQVAQCMSAYADFAAAADHMTPHGNSRLQNIHDMSASGGALCKAPGNKAANMTSEEREDLGILLAAVFTSGGERDALQVIHDAAISAGAGCRSLGKSGQVSSDNRGERGYMGFSDDPAYKAMLAEIDDLKKKSAANAEFAATTLKEKWDLEAESFYEKMRLEHKVFPHQKGLVTFGYVRACKEDHEHGGTVSFTMGDGKEVVAKRVDAFKAQWESNIPHNLTGQEQIVPAGGADFSVLSPTGGQQKQLFKPGEKEALMSATELGQAASAYNTKNGTGTK